LWRYPFNIFAQQFVILKNKPEPTAFLPSTILLVFLDLLPSHSTSSLNSEGCDSRDLLWFILILFLPATWLVPHPADKVPKVSSADSCTLARRRRLHPKSWRHPPVNGSQLFAGSVSLSWQTAWLQDTLQQHIAVSVRVTTCLYLNLSGLPPLRTNIEHNAFL
jgi:hypothetical protein